LDEDDEELTDHCDSYCSHGGVCVLDRGHEGLHDSRFCRWSDAEALTRDAANVVIASQPGGEDFVRTWELIVPRGPREIEEE
jgi:hypothetical protein